MASKRFNLLISLRVILMLVNTLTLAFIWQNFELLFTPVLLLIILLVQLIELIYFVNKTNRELQKFLEALNYGDYAVSFNNAKLGGAFKELDQSFKNLIETVRSSKAEKESQSELLKLALENIKLGLIIVDDSGRVILLNQAAQAMLKIPHFRHWQMFEKKATQFARQLDNFSFQGRKLIELDSGNGNREFYLDLEHINLLGTNYHLISFSDLKNEIEQKEIDAWHKLIRILAHEVMNSVTPVTSLSETVKNLLTNEKGEPLPSQEIDEERIDDILLALDTIIKRSRGMLGFVEEYRKLTKLPAPHYENFKLRDLFEEVTTLMKSQAQQKGVVLNAELPHQKLQLRADRKMIEQVLINLISNAIYSCEAREDARIDLQAQVTENHLIIEVSDNGAGIPEDILPSVFIPFFSTRKNGTGIGLTLSKNIMQIHNGSISVHSIPNEQTRFRLSFNL